MNRVSSILVLLATLSPVAATAQTPATRGDAAGDAPAEARSDLSRRSLSGPRFGFTTFTGDIADQRRSVDLETIMSQFGWQFETQILSAASGNQALIELLFLLGGVESDEFNLSGSFLTGYRLANGLEFGVGPSISYSPEAEKRTSSIVVAGGTTIPFGEIYVPLNLAVSIAEGGPRLTTLLGWVIG